MSDTAAVVAGESAGFSADLDAAFDTPDTGDAGLDAGAEETAGEEIPEEQVDETPEEEPLAAAEDEAEPVVDPAKPKEALPDDVRMVERDGKKTYYLPENRYRLYEGDHHLATEFRDRFVQPTADGKPASAEEVRAAVDLRDRAYLGMQEMDLDFISGDPGAQAKFLNHFIEQGKQAVAAGEVEKDPIVSLAGTFFDMIAQQHPEAYGQMQGRAANQMIQDLYEVATAEGNEALFLSVQHMENTLFNRFHRADGTVVKGTRNAAPARPSFQSQNARPMQQQPAPNNGVQQWNNFRVSTDGDTKAAIRGEVTAQLAAVKSAYDKAGLPDTYEGVSDRLNSVVSKELSDPNSPFKRSIDNLLRAAQITSSEQRRQGIRAQIVQAYQNRAKVLIAEKLPKIQIEAGKATKQRLDATHERRAAAQERRAPTGGGPAASRSLIPTDKGEWNPNQFGKEIDRLLG